LLKVTEEYGMGRPISWYQFIKPTISYEGFNFEYLEFPSPKKSNRYPDSFTHLAFVLNDITLDQYMQLHPTLKWITDKQKSNGIIELERDNQLQIKIHASTVPQILHGIY
jgi:predicted metalloenzyme YecM